MMRFRNITLLIVLAALACWYYFYEIRGSAQREEAAREATRILPGVTASDITSLAITRIPRLPDGTVFDDVTDLTHTIRFSHIDMTWKLVEPVCAEGNQDTIGSLAADLAVIAHERVIEEQPSDRTPYGLDIPAFVIDIESLKGNARIQLGDENPAGNAFYASIGTDPAIILINNGIRPLLLKNVDHFRDRRLISVADHAMTSFSIIFPLSDMRIAFVNEGDEWVMEQPIRSPVDAMRLEDIVATLASPVITGFIDAPEDPLRYGLARPSVVLEFVSGDNMQSVSLGTDADPGGKTRYARKGDTGPVVIVGKNVAELFPEDVFYYRSKTVCRLDSTVVQRIRIDSENGSIVAEKDDSLAWRIIEPSVLRTDGEAVSGFLSDLTYLRATGVMAMGDSFGSPIGRIQVFESEEAPVWELTIGGRPVDGVGRWVQASDDTTVYRVSDEDIDRLLPEIDRFMDKRVVEFDRMDLSSVEISSGDRIWRYSVNGDRYNGITGEPALDVDTMENLTWTLHTLRFERIIQQTADPTAGPDVFGLDHPIIAARLSFSNKRIVEIQFSKRDAVTDEIYARLGDFGVIGTVDPRHIEPLLILIP
ncbi:DUF4340 domain-containing protein [bacterium]|nr:DUF4340 domain-containing protein [candidate division CSSED10-310 bacterium]